MYHNINSMVQALSLHIPLTGKQEQESFALVIHLNQGCKPRL